MPKLAGRARCYCGSGNMYKDCHMEEDKVREEEQRLWDTAHATLRQEFARFALDDRFKLPLAAGLALFWDSRYTLETVGGMNGDEALRFFDWFVMDYVPEGGQRLLDVYAAEKSAGLEERERQLLATWRSVRPASAWQIAKVERPLLYLRDLFTGEEAWIEDAAAAREMDVEEVVLARILPVGGLFRAAAGAARLPDDESAGLVPEMTAAREAFVAEQPDSSWDDFLRARGYLLTHYAMRQAEAHGRPAVHPTTLAAEMKNRSIRQLRRLTKR